MFSSHPSKGRRPKILFVTTVSITVRAFLIDIIRRLADDYEVVVLSNNKDDSLFDLIQYGVRVEHLSFSRRISPLQDFFVCIQILLVLFRIRPTLIISITPKAGFFSQVAASLLNVPFRAHIFTGQVWATKLGFSRRILRQIDVVIARCVTHILVDSHSQAQFLVQEGVLREGVGVVVGEGSLGGVDTKRFRRACVNHSNGHRNGFAFNREGKFTVTMLGRMNRDKGVLEFLAASRVLAKVFPLQFFLVGPIESTEILIAIREAEKEVTLSVFGGRVDVENYIAFSDVVVIPSHREGFCNVAIEAAACEVPTVGSSIYGLCDSIVDGVTGLLFNCGDVDDLVRKVSVLLNDEGLRMTLGRNARNRVLKYFDSEIVSRNYVTTIKSIISGSNNEKTFRF
jgi:glycosyltransferase involved in cell wall biosynthesis